MHQSTFPSWPNYSEEEIVAVQDVLQSNKVNYWNGKECVAFEREFADWTGAGHAIALANGTVALELAWRTLGIGAGDEVICTPRSYQASAASIAMEGAKTVFADVDRDSQNITPETVAPLINSRTRAILCVHLAGWPCDMEAFQALAQTHNLRLVEDCAQAHGATIAGRAVGTFGDIGAWSFCNDKIITTGGEGGMVTTNDEALWKSAWSFKEHGKSWQAVFERDHPPGFRWLHEGWGSNWRMTEMQAAIGRIQLKRMNDWHLARARNATRLIKAFSSIDGLRCPRPPAGVEHAWYKLFAFVEPARMGPDWTRDRIMGEINTAGVPCLTGGCPEIYLEKVFVEAGLGPPNRLPVAAELGETSLMFLVHPTLTDKDIDRTIEVVGDVMRKATG